MHTSWLPLLLGLPQTCSIHAAGWRGQGRLCWPSPQPPAPNPQLGCPPRQAAVPARGESQGLCHPLSCCPDGSRCAWRSPGLPPASPDICRLPRQEAHPGEAPGGRGFLKCSPPRHTAASGPPPVCAQGPGCLVDSCHWEARAVTHSMMGLRKGKVPTHLHASGVHESLGTPWRPFPLSLGSPHHLLSSHPAGWAEAGIEGPRLPGLPAQTQGSLRGDLRTSIRKVICVYRAPSCTRQCVKFI